MKSTADSPANGRFRIDLHVHTGRYSQCAEFLDPRRIEEYAVRAGLSGVVITEHDASWRDHEISALQASAPAIVIYRGIEVSAKEGHLVVIGANGIGPLDRGAPSADVIGRVATHRGATVLAHPYRDGDPSGIPIELVDAVEVASTSFSAEEARRAEDLCRLHDKPAVAASDAHALPLIGWAWTEFPFLPGDERQLADAIRNGLGVAVSPRPFPG